MYVSGPRNRKVSGDLEMESEETEVTYKVGNYF